MNLQKILVADDETETRAVVGGALVKEGYNIETAVDGSTAWEAIQTTPPDLAIVGLLMERMNGLELCQAVRAHANLARLPLIMTSARSTEKERIAAFEVGVDDFVTKPFSLRELVLRVRAILRGTPALRKTATVLRLGGILLDAEKHLVSVEGTEVTLSGVEYNLLRYLMKSPRRVHSREELMTQVWNSESIALRTIDTQIRRLRGRLGPAGDQIETVRNYGYRLSETVASED